MEPAEAEAEVRSRGVGNHNRFTQLVEKVVGSWRSWTHHTVDSCSQLRHKQMLVDGTYCSR